MEEKEVKWDAIEKKWQAEWAKKKVFEVSETSKKKKFYCLEMFPYPSASYLHMGHVRNYAMGDVFARFKRMQGFNVLYPMGYDSFGLPAENAAKKEKIHPKKYTENAIKKIMEYQRKLGNSYDWTRTLSTHEHEYYKWNQYFFIKFLEKGLAYRKEAPVNFCENCDTTLANEEVEDGKCWRCHSEIREKKIAQWFLKITEYADELLEGIDKLQWPERLKTLQRNWIGRSEGSEIIFHESEGKEKIKVFTTRIDTLFGCTFIALAPEHGLIDKIVSKEKRKEAKKFIEKAKAKTIEERTEKGKEGIFTGSYAINPANGEEVPVYVGEYVLADYGTGAIMCVPSHDKRDFEFAQKHNIPIVKAIEPEDKRKVECFTEDGILVNSNQFDGLKSAEARKKITEWLAEKKLAFFVLKYKIKDWLISRQRYWGTPIPIIYCDKCGIVPAPEKDLPVLLPEDVKFTEKGNPLLTSKKFRDVKCPKCGLSAKRETDTMGGFVDSSWYFLRYCSPKEKKAAFSKDAVKYWMPVDQYIGGIEHAVGHLMYSRFWTKALRDLGMLSFDEPFTKLFNQGIVHKDGKRMSKSYGNIVTQDEISKKYGIDTARLFLLFVAAPDSDMEWNDKGIEGMHRFVNKVYNLITKGHLKNSNNNKFVLSKVQKLIKKITDDIENFRFNLAIIGLMEFTNLLEENRSTINDKTFVEAYEVLLKLLSTFAPHLCEEMWHKIGNKTLISSEKWPVADEKKIEENEEKKIESVEKVIEDVNHIIKLIGKEPKKIYIYALPKEIGIYKESEKYLSEKLNAEVIAHSVADKKKHDPQNKAGKAKPGKPAIYVE